MAFVFEQFVTPTVAAASYLVGDDAAGVAAVVDPQVDIQRYLDAARRHGVTIEHVVQTHVHDDFVSGAVALSAAAGGAPVHVSGHDAPDYGHRHHVVRDGDTIDVGATRLTVRHTPGHTPEHISLLVARGDDDGAPFAVLSGGSLTAGGAGRTDQHGERTAAMTRSQYETLTGFYALLDDGVVVWPTHLAVTPCGSAAGDRTSTTIGHERTHNPLLQHRDAPSFAAAVLAAPAASPRHGPRMLAINVQSPPRQAAPPVLRGLMPARFEHAMAGGAVVVDTRQSLAFGGGHVEGAVNIGLGGPLATWAGWLLDPDREILVVADTDAALPAIVDELARTGYVRYAGYLSGGMAAWDRAGLPRATLAQCHAVDVHRLQRSGGIVAIDVRSPAEWARGHVPAARHLFLPDLPAAIGTLPRDTAYAVYCDSGWRASIGASLLQSRGFDVVNVAGGWHAWKACGLPVVATPAAAAAAAEPRERAAEAAAPVNRWR